MGKKEKTLTVILSAIVMLILATVTYGFFSAGVTNENKQEASITTGDMKLTFADGNNGFASKLSIGQTATKTFTIENTGSLDTGANLYWLDFTNNYTLGSLTYTLEYSDSESGKYTILKENENVPQSTTPSKILIQDKIAVPVDTKYYYKLTITLNNLEDVDQNADLTAVMNTKFTLEGTDTPESYKTLAALGLTANSGTPDFSQVATTDEGIYATEDNYGTSYYFRGDVTNNYVKFGTMKTDLYNFEDLFGYHYFESLAACETAMEDYVGEIYKPCSKVELSGKDMYWRIVRINGNGTLRLIYDGTSKHNNGEINEDRVLLLTLHPDYTRTNWDDQWYELWYNLNISGTEYDTYITHSNSCDDNTYRHEITNCYDDEDCEWVDYSAAYDKLITNKSPSLKNYTCKPNQKISHITADEVALAGGVYSKENTDYYLFKGVDYYSFSTAYNESIAEYYMFFVYEDGTLGDTDSSLGGAPVINLSAEYARTLKLDANGVYVAE